MKKIYWKGVKRRIGKIFDTIYNAILIFTNWLG